MRKADQYSSGDECFCMFLGILTFRPSWYTAVSSESKLKLNVMRKNSSSINKVTTLARVAHATIAECQSYCKSSGHVV